MIPNRAYLLVKDQKGYTPMVVSRHIVLKAPHAQYRVIMGFNEYNGFHSDFLESRAKKLGLIKGRD